MSFDKFFWFSQPSSVMGSSDFQFGYVFVLLFALGVIFRLAAKFAVKHLVVSKLMRKISSLGLTIGIAGLVWWGLRYENTPIFGRRYWAALVLLLGLVWLVWIIKYALTRFRTDKADHDKFLINQKYLNQKR